MQVGRPTSGEVPNAGDLEELIELFHLAGIAMLCHLGVVMAEVQWLGLLAHPKRAVAIRRRSIHCVCVEDQRMIRRCGERGLSMSISV